jgi:hypothetical protein
MSKPKYEDLLRRELENNKDLNKDDRLNILRELAKIEIMRLKTARSRILAGKDRKIKKEKFIPGRPVKLPPEPAEEAKVPIGQELDKLLAEIKRGNEEKQDGCGKQHEHLGPERHPSEDGTINGSGS